MALIERQDDDGLAILTLNRPEALNALSPSLFVELRAHVDDIATKIDTIGCVILCGKGRSFSAGNDLKWTAQHGMPRVPKNGFGGITARFDLWKPVIAAVNGFALGGGLEIALACDIIVAAEHAALGLPEPRVGLMAAAGGVHRLPRSIPLKIAMGLMLTGKPITAAEAARLGLVNEVVPKERLMETAARWAAEIAECSPLSVQATKQAAMQGLDTPVSEAVVSPYEAVARLWASEDAKEGPLAFAQKRKPRWTGR